MYPLAQGFTYKLHVEGEGQLPKASPNLMLVALRVGGKQPESTRLKISGGMQELAFPSFIEMVDVCTQMPEDCFN